MLLSNLKQVAIIAVLSLLCTYCIQVITQAEWGDIYHSTSAQPFDSVEL